MLQILIVEDNISKLQKIALALVSTDNVNINDITYTSTSIEARELLNHNYYDLMICDIAIPIRIDQPPTKEAGINLIKDAIHQRSIKTPGSIIAITQFDDIFENNRKFFDENLLTLIKYDETNDGYTEKLKNKITQIISSNQKPSVPFETDLLIVCALKHPELEHVLQNGWSWSPPKPDNSQLNLFYSQVECNGTQRSIVAASCPRMGLVPCAVLTTQLIQKFKPNYVCMTGISAGIEPHVKMGDIVSPDIAWDWGSGKWKEDETEAFFLNEPYQHRINIDTRYQLERFSDSDFLSEIKSKWPADKPDTELSLHIGPIASGSSVISSNYTKDGIVSQHRKVISIDMETFAVFEAAFMAPEPRPSVVTFKSIVDYANPNKNDNFHQYSSYVSAMAMTYFFEKIVWNT